MSFNPSSISRVCVRATNWLGDAVMSLPAIRAIRRILPHAHIALVARPWVADLYARERSIDRIIPYTAQKGLRAKREFASLLRHEHFDAAILLQNAFDAALLMWLAGIPERIGYNRDGRRLLLTQAIPVPEPGEIPRHERFYYLELLRRAGMIEGFADIGPIRLEGLDDARAAGAAHLARLGISGAAVGVSPGAAYGNAKRWLPESFAAVAQNLAPGAVLLFGSAGERPLSETVAVFGATDDTTTGPTGPLARVVREHAECSPCLLRECPIDHRCMTAVTVERVTAVAQDLWKETASAWIPELKS